MMKIVRKQKFNTQKLFAVMNSNDLVLSFTKKSKYWAVIS